MPESTQNAENNRAAILLIHGVGQQKPYQMLDVFARGLIDHYGPNIEAIEPRLFQSPKRGKVRSCISLHFKDPIGRTHIKTLDLFEFYWAGMVQGKVTLRQMLRWALRTSIPPLKLWSQQTTLPANQSKSFLQLLPTLIRELATAFGLLLAIGLVIFPIPYIVVHFGSFARAGRDLLAILQTLTANPPGLFGTIVLLILATLEVFIIFSVLQIGFRLRGGKTMESSMLARWGIGSAGLFVLLLLLLGLIIGLSGLAGFSVLVSVGKIIASAPVGWGLFSLLLGYLAGQFMIDFVGDIPLYVDADEKSEFHRTRDEIKRAGVARLTNLIADADYKAIFVAGHSLGSVIAYDIINQIIRESRAGVPHELSKLRGLLTFGSPLDKIYYFFRDTVGDKQAVRAQIQSFLHGFRKKSSGRDYGRYRFARYKMPKVESLQWVNVYSVMDIVSDRLDFYDVDEQLHLSYYSPLTAHVSYWNDSDFYCVLATLLESRASYEACLQKKV